MSTAFEIRREGEVNYSKPLARALLRDCRLSFGARGLFAFLWDLPKGWRTNSAHLVKMSPQGRDAIRTLLKELQSVGALRDEAIHGERGRLAGRRWVLVTPERWATESPLSIEASSTERRDFRPSVKPRIGKPSTKVHQGEGSSIKTTTNPMQVVEVDELVNAAVWVVKRGGGKIQKEAAYKHIVRKRILANGPNNEDKQSLIEWRAAQEQANKDARNQAGSEFKIDPSAQKKGALLFTSNTIREKFGNQ